MPTDDLVDGLDPQRRDAERLREDDPVQRRREHDPTAPDPGEQLNQAPSDIEHNHVLEIRCEPTSGLVHVVRHDADGGRSACRHQFGKQVPHEQSRISVHLRDSALRPDIAASSALAPIAPSPTVERRPRCRRSLRPPRRCRAHESATRDAPGPDDLALEVHRDPHGAYSRHAPDYLGRNDIPCVGNHAEPELRDHLPGEHGWSGSGRSTDESEGSPGSGLSRQAGPLLPCPGRPLRCGPAPPCRAVPSIRRRESALAAARRTTLSSPRKSDSALPTDCTSAASSSYSTTRSRSRSTGPSRDSYREWAITRAAHRSSSVMRP